MGKPQSDWAQDPDELTTVPATGERFRFVSVTDDLARIDWRLGPGGRSPLHRHPHQVERVTAIAGSLVVRLRDRTFGEHEVQIVPGRSLSVPAGVTHEFHNTGADDAHMVVDFIPALEMRLFFETLARLARDENVDKRGRPRNPLLLAAFVSRFDRVFVAARPPRWLQRLLLGPLAALARVRGIQPAEAAYATRTSTSSELARAVSEAEPLQL